jgi:hypothetical protein
MSDARAIDLGHLGEVAAWMREVGATALAVGDVHITLGPAPPGVPVQRAAAEPVGAEVARAAKAAHLRALALGLR